MNPVPEVAVPKTTSTYDHDEFSPLVNDRQESLDAQENSEEIIQDHTLNETEIPHSMEDAASPT